MHFHKPMPQRTPLQDRLFEAKLSLKAWIDAMTGYPRLRRMFRERVGYAPNIHAPTTYNEKIQWRKIHDRDPRYPVVSDKLRMRDYLRDLLGAEAAGAMLPRLYMATDDPARIDFAALPDTLVLKANHGSGWNIFLRPGAEADEAALRAEMARWLRLSYGKLKHEWAYQHIPRRIMVEELIEGPDGRGPDDLKFSIIGGKCEFIFWDDDRWGGFTQHICDRDWAELPWTNDDLPKGTLPPPPPGYDRMLEIAERIGREFDMIRVDFLFTAERFVLNELTLYRGSGMMPYDPPEWDRYYGEKWVLPTG